MNLPVRQTNTMAVISLIAGILGWSALPALGSIVAIITGHMARGEIRRSPEAQEGDGMALAGLIMGYLMVGLCLLGILLFVLFIGGLLWMVPNYS